MSYNIDPAEERAVARQESDSPERRLGQSGRGEETVETPEMRLPAATTVNTQHLSRRGPKTAANKKDAEDEQRFVDEFGFELDEDGAEEEARYVSSVDGERVQRRELKWSRMTSEWNQTLAKNSDKLKERCRKGVPTKLRGIVWQLLTGSRLQMEAPENQRVFEQLLLKKIPDDTEGLIERDLARTFPTHALFRDADGVGQTYLRNVLHAYAVLDPEVGYVQGMGFIVSALLTQMNQIETFWCFQSLMTSDLHRLRELYRPGFPMLQMFFYQLKRLMQKQLPKLAKHMEEIGLDVSYFAAQWFLTIFVYHFQFRALLRVWDIFFSEGWKIVFRVGICLLKWEEARLMSMTLDEILPQLKLLHEGKDSDEILTRALKVKFKTEQLLEFRKEYESGCR